VDVLQVVVVAGQVGLHAVRLRGAPARVAARAPAARPQRSDRARCPAWQHERCGDAR